MAPARTIGRGYWGVRCGAFRWWRLAALAVWLYLKPLRRGELAVVYACVVICIPWCICIKAALESSTANLFELQRRSEPQLYAWAKEMPWWGPTIPTGDEPPRPEALEAIRGFALGNGGRVPWRLWWRPMLFWAGMCLAHQAMLMGLLLMFRKRWVQHERLPFVWSEPALHLIRGGEVPWRRRWLWFLIGLGLCLPAAMFISPTGEALSSWGMLPWVGTEGIRGGFDLTEFNILPGTNLRLFWGPLVLTMFLLMPVDVLMTTALTYVLLGMLLPGIMRSAGLQIGPTLMRNFTKWGIRFGGCAGLLIWGVWYNRATIWGYVRSLWGGPPTNAESEDELPRRFIFVLAVGGTVAFIAMGCYGTELIQMVILTALILIYAFAQVRQRAEGMPLTYDNNVGSHQMVSIQQDILKNHYLVSDSASPGDSWATHWMQWGFCGQMKTFGPQNMLLEAFKIAHELKVNAREVGKAILLAMLVVAVVTPPLYVQLMYVYGFDNNYQGALSPWASFTQWSERSASYGLHSTSNVFLLPGEGYIRYQNLFNMVYGVLIIGALFHLRREYPRFPVSPIGVVLGAQYWWLGAGLPFSPEYVWFSFLLAGIIKLLIFRWLGVRSFRERVQPAVIMLLCGMIFGMAVYAFRYVSLGWGALK